MGGGVEEEGRSTPRVLQFSHKRCLSGASRVFIAKEGGTLDDILYGETPPVSGWTAYLPVKFAAISQQSV